MFHHFLSFMWLLAAHFQWFWWYLKPFPRRDFQWWNWLRLLLPCSANGKVPLDKQLPDARSNPFILWGFCWVKPNIVGKVIKVIRNPNIKLSCSSITFWFDCSSAFRYGLHVPTWRMFFTFSQFHYRISRFLNCLPANNNFHSPLSSFNCKVLQ